jgi:O-antigen/teichoic acid export membrane protein
MMLNNLALIKDKVIIDDMTRHGIMMVAFAVIGAFLSYMYQLAMGWLLTPEDYGIVISLLALLVIVSVFSSTIETTVTKFVSKESVGNKLGRVNYLWKFTLKRTLLLGLAIFAVLALFSPLISSFLNIGNNWYPIIIFLSLVLTFGVSANYGTLRGLQRFLALGISGTLGACLKLAIAVGLVYMGFKVSGALLSVALAAVIAFFVSIYFLRDLPKVGNEKVEVRGVRSYTGLAFLALLAFAVLTNIDVILAKQYLSAVDAGNYAAISVIGKLAFFIPGGIAIAMFPKTSHLFEVGGVHRLVLRKAILLTLLLAGVVVIIYWLFPQFVVNILFMGKYPDAIPYLFKYGLAMAFFAVSSLLMFYFLSLNRTRVAYLLIGAVLLQLCLIILFHSSIGQIVNVMLICGASCLVLILPFYLKVRNDFSYSAGLQ